MESVSCKIVNIIITFFPRCGEQIAVIEYVAGQDNDTFLIKFFIFLFNRK